MGVKIRLGAMMFLQYAIWGAWAPVLSDYLQNNLGFDGIQTGIIYSLLPLATIIAPFIGGQIADRYLSGEKFIAVLQLLGGALLIWVSTMSDYRLMAWVMLFYCLLYAPTLALTNSVAFINLKNSEKEFGQIRVWGTIGWIAAGLGLTLWRNLSGGGGIAMQGDALLLAGIFSLIMGLFAFGLPHTPPQKEGTKPLAFLEALKMLRDKNFLIFIIISFVVATELMFYYILTAPFLTSPQIRVSQANLPMVMAIAQLAEIFVMALLLPYLIKKTSIRKILALGVLAWPLRYIIFAVGTPAWLVWKSMVAVSPGRFLFCLFLCGGLHIRGYRGAQGHPTLRTEPDHSRDLRHRKLPRKPLRREGPEHLYRTRLDQLDGSFPGPGGPDRVLCSSRTPGPKVGRSSPRPATHNREAGRLCADTFA